MDAATQIAAVILLVAASPAFVLSVLRARIGCPGIPCLEGNNACSFHMGAVHFGAPPAQAIVSVVDKEGYIIHQNAASMAALGMQGHLHRSQHCPGGLNLLDELFCEDPAARAEFQSVTDANNMFSMVMKIRSPVMRRWLEVGTRDVWHQVQISKAKDAVTLKEVYVVAQVDVSSTVLIEHTVMQLQAENHDLHWTTAWLEDQKRKTEELNQR